MHKNQLKYKKVVLQTEQCSVTKPKRWWRKGECPSCGVPRGYNHEKGCGLEFSIKKVEGKDHPADTLEVSETPLSVARRTQVQEDVCVKVNSLAPFIATVVFVTVIALFVKLIT